MDSDQVEEIKKEVQRYYKIYDVRFDRYLASFYIDDIRRDSTAFNRLNGDLKELGYIAALRRMGGEDIVTVAVRPKVEQRSSRTNLIMLFVTIFTTIWAGSFLWGGSYGEIETVGDSFKGEYMANGALFFALPLMTILGCHELGHYFMARRYGLNASLPFFIPAPPPILFGTFGAFISIRDPMPNRKALMDIGLAGPLAGFLVAIPITLLGLFLSSTDAATPDKATDLIIVNMPALFIALSAIVEPAGTLMHPTAFAGWVGLLVTAMNLLPAGQLDGGHIARALFKEKARFVSYLTVFLLVILSFAFMGWLIFAFLIIFLGTSHPPPLDEVSELGGKRKVMGVVALVILLACFVPVPLEEGKFVPDEYGSEIQPFDDEVTIAPGGTAVYMIAVKNSGNMRDTLEFQFAAEGGNGNWSITASPANLTLGKGKVGFVNVSVAAPANASMGDTSVHHIQFVSGNETSKGDTAKLTTHVGGLSLDLPVTSREVSEGNLAQFEGAIVNLLGTNDTVHLSMNLSGNGSAIVRQGQSILADWSGNATVEIDLPIVGDGELHIALFLGPEDDDLTLFMEAESMVHGSSEKGKVTAVLKG